MRAGTTLRSRPTSSRAPSSRRGSAPPLRTSRRSTRTTWCAASGQAQRRTACMRMRRACYWLHGRAACTERRVAAQRPRALPGRAACVPRRTAPRAGGGFAAGPTLAPAAPARRAPARTGRAPAPRPLTAPGRRAQIAVGDEGYLVGGSSWLDNGSKGDDWAGNLQDPNIAFGTVHICARPPAACPACPRLPRRRGERQRPRTHCKQQRRARCLSVVCRLPASGLQRAWLFGYLAGQELRALQAPSSAYARAGEPLTRCAPARRADPGRSTPPPRATLPTSSSTHARKSPTRSASPGSWRRLAWRRARAWPAARRIRGSQDWAAVTVQ